MASVFEHVEVWDAYQLGDVLVVGSRRPIQVDASKVDARLAQIGVLRRVASDKEMNQTRLARELRLNDSAITAMVRRLIGLGMLEKARCRNDSRAWVLTLTQDGEQALARASEHALAINTRIEEEFGPDGLDAFVAKLNRLIEICDEEQAADAGCE